MGIEWTPLGFESDMTMEVRDNTLGETYVLDSGLPFNVTVRWEIPAPVVPGLGGSFRIRVYAESVGPGPELQIGPTATVAVNFTADYATVITIPGSTLPGEGELFNGVPASGVYKLVAVLQHLNPGANEISGYAEFDHLLQMRTP
jgi:hypothetical protein